MAHAGLLPVACASYNSPATASSAARCEEHASFVGPQVGWYLEVGSLAVQLHGIAGKLLSLSICSLGQCNLAGNRRLLGRERLV